MLVELSWDNIIRKYVEKPRWQIFIKTCYKWLEQSEYLKCLTIFMTHFERRCYIKKKLMIKLVTKHVNGNQLLKLIAFDFKLFFLYNVDLSSEHIFFFSCQIFSELYEEDNLLKILMKFMKLCVDLCVKNYQRTKRIYFPFFVKLTSLVMV